MNLITEIPSSATFITTYVTKPCSVRRVISLDGGKTWGGNFIIRSDDLFKTPHIEYLLDVKATFERAGYFGISLPPECGVPRLVKCYGAKVTHEFDNRLPISWPNLRKEV